MRRSSPKAVIAVASPSSVWSRHTNPGAASAAALTGASRSTNSLSSGESSGSSGSAMLT